MDNLTHTLTGIALANAGLKRKTRYAMLALVVGCNLPDIDIVSEFWGTANYLKYHRGITHSILGAAVLACALAGVIYYFGRKAAPPGKTSPPLNAPWLLAICGIALESHVLMDFTNQYGIRPFLPFSGRWYGWDIMFIFDPLLLMVLVAGLAIPALFRLISEEVGARKPGFQRGAILSLCFLVGLWGVRDFAHRRVLNQLDAHTYGGENPVRLGAFPSPANPFDWVGVVETDSAYHVLAADALASDVDISDDRVFYKPESSPALEAAEKTRTAEIFLNFARFPWAMVEPTEKGYDIILRDLRFYSPQSRRTGFVTEVVLNKDLKVISQSFSFRGRSRMGED
jgi:inner membrane protein